MENATKQINRREPGKFPSGFTLGLIAINVAGFSFAMLQGGYGFFVILFLLVPINIVFFIGGLIRTLLLSGKYPTMPTSLRYAIVTLLPTVITVLEFLIDGAFGKHSGC